MAAGDRIYIADKPTQDNINKNIGAPTDIANSGGSTTFSLIRYIVSMFTGSWTTTRAGKLDGIDTINTNTSTANTNVTNVMNRIGVSTDTANNAGTTLFGLIKYIVSMFTGSWTTTRAGYIDTTVSSRAAAADYTATRAAKLDNLDATVSSRAAAATAVSNADYTAARAAKLDNLNAPISVASGIRQTWFLSSGTFTVPVGVTQILVTACGGGGGGGGASGANNAETAASGYSGGTTVIAGLISLSGGGGGDASGAGGTSGGSGGGAGGGTNVAASKGITGFGGSSAGGGGSLGGGGAGYGGAAYLVSGGTSLFWDGQASDLGGGTFGGGGGSRPYYITGGMGGYNLAGGGGGGAAIFKQRYNVTAGSNIAITVGAGGAGGGNYRSGAAGGPGLVIIEW